MKTIKFGDKEYQIQFGYIVTAKSGIIGKIANIEKMMKGETTPEEIDKFLMFIPEIVLVGLQKFHRDEFGYDYNTGEGKDAALDKVGSLVDDYFDREDADFNKLLDTLTEELMNNSFLSKLFREEQENQAKKTQKKSQKKKEN